VSVRAALTLTAENYDAGSEIDMKQRVSIARFGLEYDVFLFTSLGDDRNGTPLTLASLLGRMNLDPWHEAATLASLPADVAAQRLASLIEAIKQSESVSLAAHLITLLPDQPKPAAPPPEPLIGTATKVSRGRRGRIRYTLWFAIFCILLLGATLVNASH
jgi:hypothetical protein